LIDLLDQRRASVLFAGALSHLAWPGGKSQLLALPPLDFPSLARLQVFFVRLLLVAAATAAAPLLSSRSDRDVNDRIYLVNFSSIRMLSSSRHGTSNTWHWNAQV
jgi:hypothetical protein